MLKRLYFFHWIGFTSLSKSLGNILCGTISRFFILFHWFIFLQTPQSLEHWSSAVSLDTSLGKVIPLILFFLLKTVFSKYTPFAFHIFFRTRLFMSTKNFVRILRGIALNLLIILGRLTTSLYSIFKSMSTMQYFSIYVGLWFHSSAFCIKHIDPIHVLLVLYQNILFSLEWM